MWLIAAMENASKWKKAIEFMASVALINTIAYFTAVWLGSLGNMCRTDASGIADC